MGRLGRIETALEAATKDVEAIRAEQEEIRDLLVDDTLNPDVQDWIGCDYLTDRDEFLVWCRYRLGPGRLATNSSLFLRFARPTTANHMIMVGFYLSPWHSISPYGTVLDSTPTLSRELSYPQYTRWDAVHYDDDDTTTASVVTSTYACATDNAKYLRAPQTTVGATNHLIGRLYLHNNKTYEIATVNRQSAISLGVSLEYMYYRAGDIDGVALAEQWPTFVPYPLHSDVQACRVGQNFTSGVHTVGFNGLSLVMGASQDKDLYLGGDYMSDWELLSVNTGAAAPSRDWVSAKIGRYATDSDAILTRLEFLTFAQLLSLMEPFAPGITGTITMPVGGGIELNVKNGGIIDYTITDPPT